MLARYVLSSCVCRYVSVSVCVSVCHTTVHVLYPLALLTAVRIFSVYFGSSVVTVYTDHSPLQFLECMAPHNAKLLSRNAPLRCV